MKSSSVKQCNKKLKTFICSRKFRSFELFSSCFVFAFFCKNFFVIERKKRDVDDFNSSKYLQTFALKLGRKMAGNLNSEALNIQEMHSQIYFWREFCSLSLKWIIETHIVESQFGYFVKKCLTAMITKPMQLSLDATK